MPADQIAAYAGAIGSAVSLFGLGLQFVWTRKQFKQTNRLARFQSAVDVPVTKTVDLLDEFEGMVHDFQFDRQGITLDALKSKGARVNRSMNTTINRAVRFDGSLAPQWIDIDTSVFEGFVEELSEAQKDRQCKALRQEITNLRGRFQTLQADSQDGAER